MEGYALILGIEHYSDSSLKPLPGAKNDADDFKNWIRLSTGGNVKKKNCKLLKSNKGLTKLVLDQIEDELVALIENAKNNPDSRRLYFFFSGHGLGVSLDEVSLLVTNWQESLAHRGISSKECQDSILEGGVFDEVFFFLDCCRSRKVNIKPQGGRLWNPGINPQAKDTNSFTAFATLHWDVAYEDDIDDDNGTRRNGYFTKALLNGLKGDAANERGEITLKRLKGHLLSETNELAKRSNRNQKPKFHSTFDSDDVVIAKIANKKTETDDDYNVSITFTEETTGPYKIEDKDLNEVSSWTKGQGIWKVKLDPGLNLLIDEGGKKEMPIKMRPQETEIKHVRF